MESEKVLLILEVKEMKKGKYKYFIILSIVIIALSVLNHYMSYSMRIGNTRFFLVETMANSNDGEPLLGLYCKVQDGGYKGVDMCGFPKIVLWNDKYVISKNHNGKDTTIISYVIINQDSVNASDGDIADLHVFNTETEYSNYLNIIGLPEREMKQIDCRISWWKLLFK